MSGTAAGPVIRAGDTVTIDVWPHGGYTYRVWQLDGYGHADLVCLSTPSGPLPRPAGNVSIHVRHLHQEPTAA